MITLKQLRYILAVEQTLHFKKAAEQCAVSQSALSTAIAEMEKHLGIQIFERDNKKVLVTTNGRQCLEKARQIQLKVDELHQLAQAQKAPLSYPISLGVIPTIAPYMLPRVLPEVRRCYPAQQLRITEEQSRVLVRMVKNGELDTAILALPYDVEGLLTFEFWQEDFYWVAHREDSLAQGQGISSDALKNTQLMLLKEGHCLKDHALTACKFQVNTGDTALASTSLHTLVQMVAGRLGTTLVPEMALDPMVTGDKELKALHLEEPGPHRTIAFIVRPNYSGLKSVELLKKVMRTEMEKAMKHQ